MRGKFSRLNRSIRSLGLTLAVVLSLCVGGGPAWGQTPYPQPESSDHEGDRWRRPAIFTALGLTAAGLLGSVYFLAKRNDYTNRFNSFQGPPGAGSADGRCATNLPHMGAPGCLRLRADAQRAVTLSKISLGFAAASALTALTLKITEPEASTRAMKRKPDWSLACAPLAGAGATCAISF